MLRSLISNPPGSHPSRIEESTTPEPPGRSPGVPVELGLRANYSSQLVLLLPASMMHVSVFAPPSTSSLPETLSREFSQSLPAS